MTISPDFVANSTFNVTLPRPPDFLSNNTWLLVTIVFVYCVTFLIGVAGNALVIFVVASSKVLQTSTNIFITNLAVSDLLMCLLVPFTPFYAIIGSWVFGAALCRIEPICRGVSVYVSTLTLTTIAVDRYFAIVHPFMRRPSSRLCMVVILIIWLVSMIIWVPIIAKFEIYECVLLTDGTYSCTCREDWSHRFQFTIFSLVLQYLLPATVITYCYCRVLAALRKRSEAAKARNSPGSGLTPSTIHALKEQQELKRNHRVTMMLIAMVSLFLVLWLPLNVINLADDFVGFPGHSRTWNYFFRLIFITADLVSMYSTVCNPFLYAYMKEDLRKAFENLLNPCMRIKTRAAS